MWFPFKLFLDYSHSSASEINATMLICSPEYTNNISWSKKWSRNSGIESILPRNLSLPSWIWSKITRDATHSVKISRGIISYQEQFLLCSDNCYVRVIFEGSPRRFEVHNWWLLGHLIWWTHHLQKFIFCLLSKLEMIFHVLRSLIKITIVWQF